MEILRKQYPLGERKVLILYTKMTKVDFSFYLLQKRRLLFCPFVSHVADKFWTCQQHVKQRDHFGKNIWIKWHSEQFHEKNSFLESSQNFRENMLKTGGNACGRMKKINCFWKNVIIFTRKEKVRWISRKFSRKIILLTIFAKMNIFGKNILNELDDEKSKASRRGWELAKWLERLTDNAAPFW